MSTSPNGFTVTGFADKVRAMTGQNTIAGNTWSTNPAGARRYHVPPDAARTIAALLTLRDQVIAPFIAGVRSPRMGRKPITWTQPGRLL